MPPDYGSSNSSYAPSYASALSGSSMTKSRQLTIAKPPPVPQQLADGVKVSPR